MAVKSIIAVDVDDSKFKAFKALYDKYQTQLAKMPEAWKAANKEQEALFLGFQKVSASLMAHSDLAAKTAAESHRASNETERQAKSWRTMARDSKDVAGNVAGMTRSFIKWTGLTTLFTGLLGGGSLWGFSHLAGSVAALRQTAAGLGVTPGQASAFGVDFGRYLSSPQGTLSAVAGALTDPTNAAYRPIAALLGNVQGQNAAQVTSQLLQKLPQLFPGGANSPTLGTVAGAYGLTEILSIEDIKRYLSASPEERRRQEKAYAGDVNKFGLDPRTMLAYQDFTTQLDRAGNSIFKTFVQGLEPLTEPLAHLSDSVTHVVQAFIDAAKDKHWITELSDGLERFASYIGTPEFDQLVKSIVDDLGQLASAVGTTVSWFIGIFGDNRSKERADNIHSMGLKTADELRADRASGKATAWSQFADIFNGGGRDIAGNPLATITTAGGHHVTVAAAGADRFKGFLEALETTGAPITNLGGYNPRKIAGTTVWSEHAFGRAIDIDQSGRNVVTKEFLAWAQSHEDLLHRIEKQYGIKSGADFRGRPDFGHFELSKGYQRDQTAKVEIHKATGADVNVSIQQLAGGAASIAGP
ncbi:MAG TPA: M15 family metallopeptidase [Xanthobacteraceae bacterium]|nr:M15 family metallopeptidase [Xanthobacteraceae bacterium]